MTEPTVAPMTTNLTPATPVTAPLPDAPAPVVASVETPTTEVATRGRVASPRTVAIRAMLDETDGEITYSNAAPLLKGLGFEVDQNTFNVTKSAWKRAKRPDAPNTAPKTTKTTKTTTKATQKPKVEEKPVKTKRVLPEVSTADAIKFVSDAGGLAKAEAAVLRDLACLKAFKLLVKQTARLAA